MRVEFKTKLKVADEVWIAAALLHREHPDRRDFSITEILVRAAKENITGAALRPGVRVHATAHCVAGRPPNPGRYRMLTETPGNRRRLFRPGDPYHPGREGAKMTPDPLQIPARYRELLAWHARSVPSRTSPAQDPLLGLLGAAASLFKEESPDGYVERLRRGWK